MLIYNLLSTHKSDYLFSMDYRAITGVNSFWFFLVQTYNKHLFY
jgi:hypothetical protein